MRTLNRADSRVFIDEAGAGASYRRAIPRHERTAPMKRSLPLLSLALAALALVAAAAVVLRSAYGGDGVADPAAARCNAPPVTFGETATRNDHREASVRFTCAGAAIAGTV